MHSNLCINQALDFYILLFYDYQRNICFDTSRVGHKGESLNLDELNYELPIHHFKIRNKPLTVYSNVYVLICSIMQRLLTITSEIIGKVRNNIRLKVFLVRMFIEYSLIKGIRFRSIELCCLKFREHSSYLGGMSNRPNKVTTYRW